MTDSRRHFGRRRRRAAAPPPLLEKPQEKHIAGLPEIAMAAVVAQPHPKWDERPVCVCILQPGKSLSLARVREFCLEGGTFAKYELPDDLLLWEELPMTGTGKLDKKNIRKALEGQGYLLPDLRNGGAKTSPSKRSKL